MSLFSSRPEPQCIGCLRRLDEIKPPKDAIGFEAITCASFVPPHAPARGRLGICRSCSVAIVTAFAHVVPREKRKA